jgi:hypothetical protein
VALEAATAALRNANICAVRREEILRLSEILVPASAINSFSENGEPNINAVTNRVAELADTLMTECLFPGIGSRQ